MSFEVKPELASGFLMVGAPVMVADAETEAAAGNVGLMGPIPDDEAPDVMGPLYRKQKAETYLKLEGCSRKFKTQMDSQPGFSVKQSKSCVER